LAGKRQHYVPRFIQRGFLANAGDSAERTWLHRHGAKAKLVGIGDIGVEDWFYSRKSLDGQPTLDDAITEYERDLSDRVKALREAKVGSLIAPQHVAETVVHLVTRTAHLRSLMALGVSRLASELEAMFTDPVRLAELLGLEGPVLGEVMSAAISKAAGELAPAGVPPAFSERLMTFILRELGGQFVTNAAIMLKPLMEGMFGDIAAQIRDAHNESLTRPITDNARVAALTQFNWTIETGEDLILPDAVVLSKANGERLKPLLFTSADETELIVMPVASDRILVGYRDGAKFDLAGFNTDAAAASQNFFISAKPFEGGQLSERIGSGPAEALDTTIGEVVRKAQHARTLLETDIPAALPQVRAHQNFSYSVRLADFGDEVLAKEMADTVQVVVAALASDLSLQDFDGLTIAVDYDAALSGIDRGDPTLPPIESSALAYGLGVAMPVSVFRDGARKEHIVFAAGIAEAWVSEDADTRAFGLHTLIKMLAGVSHTTQYVGAAATNFKPDIMAREFHGAVATAPSGYWSARQAAFVAPNEGETYAGLVVQSLEFAEQEIALERAKMRDSSDVGGAAWQALQCVSAVLGHAADWIGHRDGLAEGERFSGDDLPERLEARGLDRWIALFGRDLAACYRHDGALEVSRLISLSRHVERLLWSLGVYCWPEGEEVRCIISSQPFIMPPAPAPAEMLAMMDD